mmetsp:Transcript_18002/g.40305  ORF Transcript_18002/g.40305 Transcript_18002/m.40305 type:complete len:89 (-) Transcript_18002:103-369(-)
MQLPSLHCKTQNAHTGKWDMATDASQKAMASFAKVHDQHGSYLQEIGLPKITSMHVTRVWDRNAEVERGQCRVSSDWGFRLQRQAFQI